jgi:pimeloyl-ACP methyl ester carboxylesterase
MRFSTATHVLATLIAMLLVGPEANARPLAEEFSFDHDDLTYAGVVERPREAEPHGMVVILPGHGCTNVVDGNQYRSFRDRLVRAGWAVALWDRAGCGGSEGEYDHDQSVQSSADEAVTAVRRLRALSVPGSNRLGFYSFSRGGWIAPLAMQSLEDIAFWITVSGPNRLENYPYMLRTNWRIRGLSESRTDQLVEEWITHYRMLHQPEVGYDAYVKATKNLFANDYFVEEFYDRPTREEFAAIQADKRKMDIRFDAETGIEIKAPGFADVLASLDVDTLAIFGEKDTVVNWRRTRDLYRRTLGTNPAATLTVHVLPDCSHGTRVVETGARGEDLSAEGLGHRCPGLYPTIEAWLEDHVTASAD